MADPRKTLILANLKTALEGIVAGSTYHRTVLAVSRSAKGLSDSRGDQIFIATCREAKKNLVYQHSEVTMTVSLAVIVYDQGDLPQALDEIQCDITKAILADETRGGYAISTNVVTTDDGLVEDLEPLATCLMEIEIQYRHSRTDPES